MVMKTAQSWIEGERLTTAKNQVDNLDVGKHRLAQFTAVCNDRECANLFNLLYIVTNLPFATVNLSGGTGSADRHCLGSERLQPLPLAEGNCIASVRLTRLYLLLSIP
jgi:hypothetical protein